jgi:predicted thioesterase
MAQRGGKRPGAGRPKGAKQAATAEQVQSIADLARVHSTTALKVLADIALKGDSESARVAAANALLDRGYGKPVAPMEVKHLMSTEEARAVVENLLPRLGKGAQG